MNKYRFSFNYSVIFLKLNQHSLESINDCFKEYVEFLKCSVIKTKKSFEIECRLVNKEDDLKKLTYEFYDYLILNSKL